MLFFVRATGTVQFDWNSPYIDKIEWFSEDLILAHRGVGLVFSDSS